MEMRTGKTKTILDEFGELEAAGQIRHLLVVAPAGVYRTWEGDADKHLSDELRRRVKLLRWDSKLSPAKRKQLVEAVTQPGPKILLVNIEALSTVEDAQTLCAKFIRGGTTMMVIDESTVIKSHTANRTKFCLAAAPHCKVRRILSGLPSPQSPLDLYTQFAFLNPSIIGFGKFDEFKHRYGIVKRMPYGPGGRMIETVVGYQNLDELQDKIAGHSFRVLLKDCTDLPEKIYMRREVAMTSEQQKLYDALVEEATAIIEKKGQEAGRVTANIVLTQLLRFQQIMAGHVVTDADGENGGQIIDIKENKTSELLAAIGECSGKAIIWAAFDHDVKKITKRLEEIYGPGSVARFWGGNKNTREAEEQAFKTDPRCRFMVATAAAGGRGRTWDVADLVVYYSNTFSLEHRAQSEERTQAIGKKTSTLYLDLVCPGTVEEKILHALRSKMSLSDAVTGDGWKEWVV
jgi:SNF2 family DNA or RNA helicase